MKRILLALAALLAGSAIHAQTGPCVIPNRGYFRIDVGTGGLFGVFAHNHKIEASKVEGCAVLDARDPTRSSIKLTFAAASVRVVDPKASEKDRAAVQHTMETEVLRIAEFPRIVFQSTAVEAGGAADLMRIHGNLTIRDKSQPVIIPVKFTRLGDGTYEATGKYKLKQSSFGIKPIQLAGGTIKVKDELEAEFEIFLK